MNVSTSINSNNDVPFYLDTLASFSVSNDIRDIPNPKPTYKTFQLANGTIAEAHFEGKHPIYGNMIFLKGSGVKIASYNQLIKSHLLDPDGNNGFKVYDRVTGSKWADVTMDDQGFLPIYHHNKQPIIASLMEDEGETAYYLHCCTGHSSVKALQAGIKNGHYSDIKLRKINGSVDWDAIKDCITCMLCKDHRMNDQELTAPYKERRPSVPSEKEEVYIDKLIPLDKKDISNDLVFRKLKDAMIFKKILLVYLFNSVGFIWFIACFVGFGYPYLFFWLVFFHRNHQEISHFCKQTALNSSITMFLFWGLFMLPVLVVLFILGAVLASYIVLGVIGILNGAVVFLLITSLANRVIYVDFEGLAINN